MWAGTYAAIKQSRMQMLLSITKQCIVHTPRVADIPVSAVI